MCFEIMEESTVDKGAAQSIRSKELQRGELLADYKLLMHEMELFKDGHKIFRKK